MADHHSKNSRILDMYERLCAGKTLNKSEEALRFGIDERSVQRDIDDIRAYLAERSISSGDDRQVVYDRQKKGFLLSGYHSVSKCSCLHSFHIIDLLSSVQKKRMTRTVILKVVLEE